MKKPWLERVREILRPAPMQMPLPEPPPPPRVMSPGELAIKRSGIPTELYSDLIDPATRAWPEAGTVDRAAILHAGPALTGADIYGTPVPEVPGAEAVKPLFKNKIEAWRSGTTPVQVETRPGDDPKPKKKKKKKRKKA